MDETRTVQVSRHNKIVEYLFPTKTWENNFRVGKGSIEDEDLVEKSKEFARVAEYSA